MVIYTDAWCILFVVPLIPRQIAIIIMKLIVEAPGDRKLEVNVPDNGTVLDVKKEVHRILNVPIQDQDIVLGCIAVPSEDLLSKYGLRENSIIAVSYSTEWGFNAWTFIPTCMNGIALCQYV